MGAEPSLRVQRVQGKQTQFHERTQLLNIVDYIEKWDKGEKEKRETDPWRHVGVRPRRETKARMQPQDIARLCKKER